MRVLIAVDGSEVAQQAAAVADGILPSGSDVVLLDVIEPDTPPFVFAADGLAPPLPDALGEIAEGRRSDTARDIRRAAAELSDQATTPIVEQGRAAQRVLEVAADVEADLVVVGTRDPGWWQRFWKGSVSRRVATHAPCSVLVVRGDAPTRRVLVAVDGSEESLQAARFAAGLDLDDAEITLLNVTEPRREPVLVGGGLSTLPMAMPPMEPAPEPDLTAAAEPLEAAAEAIDADDVAVEVDTSPSDALVRAAERMDADLIVVGTRDANLMQRLLGGSVSRSVLDDAPCSVLIAR